MEASSNQLSFLVVNPRFTDPHVSELESLAAKIIDTKSDFLFLETNPICGKWISEKLKEVGINVLAWTPSKDTKKYWLINNKHIHTLNGEFYDGGSSFDAYKGAIKDHTTDKIYVFGIAILHSREMPLTEDISSDKVLERHGLDKWFDLNHQLKEYTKSEVESVMSTSWNSVIYNNIIKLLPKPEKQEEEKAEHEHHGISALIHKVIDKKKEPVKETKPAHVVNAINISTIYCKVRMEKHAGANHVIDNGEKLHQLVFREKSASGMYSGCVSVSHNAF